MSSGRIKKIMLPLLICLTSISLACASFILTLYDSKDDSNQIVEPNIDSIKKATAYILNKPEVIYSSVESALNVAKNGDVVTLIPPSDANYPSVATPNKVTYTVTENCIIKPGVTLLIPTDSASVSSAGNNLDSYIDSMQNDDHSREASDYSKFATTNPNRYLRVTLEVSNNVTIYNYGNIIVSGYLSSGTSNAGMLGQTSHSYSQILLGKNARIVQETSQTNSANDAKIYCLGYISEKEINNDSQVIVSNGSLYIPFIINDYRGFQFSWAMTVEAIENYRCSPFNQFHFRNIDSLLTIKYAAKVYATVSVYLKYSASVINIDETFPNLINLIGNSSNNNFALTFNNTLSYLKFKYDKNNNTINLDFYGGVKLNPIELELGNELVKVDLSTANAYFPVSYQYNITLNKAPNQSDAIYDITAQRVKLLPGSKLIINDGVRLNGNEMIIYSAFFDGTAYNGKNSINNYDSVKYPLKDGAQCIKYGNSILSFNYLAGTIYNESQTSDDILYSVNSISCREAWSFSSNFGGSIFDPAWATSDYLIINESLQIVSIDNLTKNKIYVGLNTFSTASQYVPSFDLNLMYNDGNTNNIEIDNYQNVVFLDNLINHYDIELMSNIYKIKLTNTEYKINELVEYNDSTNKIVAINSNLSIINNEPSGGANEFLPQSMSIKPNGDLYEGQQVLFEATIDNYDKIYDKSVSWSVSNNEFAQVSVGSPQNIAYVEGLKNTNGQLITITAQCGNIVATYDIEVKGQEDVSLLEGIQIRNEDGVASNPSNTGSLASYENGDVGEFSVWFLHDGQYVDSSSSYLTITWTLTGNQDTGHSYISDPNNPSAKLLTISGVTKINIHFIDAGATDDNPTLTCKVVSSTNETFEAKFKMTHEGYLPCFEAGTIIETNHGPKAVEDLTKDDLVLTFNHFNGKKEYKEIGFMVNHGTSNYNVAELYFDDGTYIGLVGSHALFDMTLNQYALLTTENSESFIGHEFIKNASNNDSFETIKLVDVNITNKITESYSLISYENFNCFANNILNVTPDVINNVNVFAFEEDLVYDLDEVNRNIKNYGLMSAEEFNQIYGNLVDIKYYYMFNLQYLNIYVANGVYTQTSVVEYIYILDYLISTGQAIIY